MTLAELNATDRSGFAAALGWIFERSPWVAELAWESRPFDTLDALYGAMTSVVAAAPVEEQLALLRAHPDLGAIRLGPDTTDDGAAPRADDSARTAADDGGRLRSGGSGRVRADGTARLQAGKPMSHASQREQSDAGLDTLTPDELARLWTLNTAYRVKFGFPFLYAVKGRTKRDILNALERRLSSPRDIEYQEALRQVYRIARFRLEETIS